MKNFLEDDIVDRAVTESEVLRLLNYRNAYPTTDQLLRLYDRGHRTAVMSSDKITDRFIERIDLTESWNNYAPLYKNRSLSRRKTLRLLERFEVEKAGDAQTLLHIYLFSGIPFSEALNRIRGLTGNIDPFQDADTMVEARFQEISDILMISKPETMEMPTWELKEQAYIYARDLLQEILRGQQK